MFLFLVTAVFTVLVFRLWTIQVYRQQDYEEFSLRNRVREVPVQSIRGEIRDYKGRTLAKDVNYRDVWITLNFKNGHRVVTPAVRRSLELLSEILDRSYKRLESDYLNKKRDPFNKNWEVCVATRIPPHKFVSLEERRIEFPEEAMIFARKVPTRYYHYGSLAAHILGLTGPIDSNEKEKAQYTDYAPYSLVGKSGIEKQYESYLHGRDGLNVITVDKNEIQRGPTIEIQEAVPGNNVVLNIDYDLQFAAEQILGASAGTIVVSTTDNAIRAMASNPRYDLNEYRSKYGIYLTDPSSPFLHRAVAGKYEPGSVFKLIDLFPILEDLKISPEYRVHCPGHFSRWGNIWDCHWKPGHGNMNLYEAVCRSCNVYFYTLIGEQLSTDGGQRLRKWAIEFGLTDKTGIDLPDEPPAAPFPSKDTMRGWTRGVGVNNAIGQGGVLLSPLQVNTAVTAIANGGVLYKPRLAQKILSQEGREIKAVEPEIAGLVDASTETFNIVKRAMWEVANNPRGTATRRLKVEGVVVAGKTGTAQAGNRGKAHAWFVCYAPYENPEIIMTIMLENGGHGGEEAAPLAEKLLNVYFGNVTLEDLV